MNWDMLFGAGGVILWIVLSIAGASASKKKAQLAKAKLAKEPSTGIRGAAPARAPGRPPNAPDPPQIKRRRPKPRDAPVQSPAEVLAAAPVTSLSEPSFGPMTRTSARARGLTPLQLAVLYRDVLGRPKCDQY